MGIGATAPNPVWQTSCMVWERNEICPKMKLKMCMKHAWLDIGAWGLELRLQNLTVSMRDVFYLNERLRPYFCLLRSSKIAPWSFLNACTVLCHERSSPDILRFDKYDIKLKAYVRSVGSRSPTFVLTLVRFVIVRNDLRSQLASRCCLARIGPEIPCTLPDRARSGPRKCLTARESSKVQFCTDFSWILAKKSGITKWTCMSNLPA